MIVKIEELRKIVDILLNRTIELGISEVEINTDYYWTIISGEREDFNKEKPPEPAVGSIIDDYNYLEKLLSGENPPTLVDINRLANILIATSESISKSDKIYL